MINILLLLLHIGLVGSLAPPGDWDRFNYAPSSRVVTPVAIHSSHGQLETPENLIGAKGKATFASSGSWLALDFGTEVGGLISLDINTASANSTLALSFTESPMFIRPTASDDSSFPSQNTTYDGILRVQAPLVTGLWQQPAATLRGGFRFLTLVSGSNAPLALSNVTCAISFMPHFPDLRAYTGYFSAEHPTFHDPDFLTKVWYGGAYTVQTNTVPLDTGRKVPFASAGTWANNAHLGVAGPIIVDGAKRDRAVWPGDMGIAVPTQFVSTNDLIPTRNALATMFAAINLKTGALPESGPPLNQQGSDTYHAWTLIGTHNYHLFSGDTEWVREIWSNFTKAVAFLEGKVDSTGLINITGLRDWARLGGGGHNSEGNALLYQVLVTASDLAVQLNETQLATAWATNATALKGRFNDAFWDEGAGLYKDNLTTTLHPQDANSFAVLFNLTGSEEKNQRISEGLQNNWNAIGPVPPELPDTISPFITGFELQAHFIAGQDKRAMDLLERTWGYMLYTDLSVQSTLLEGFTANGSLSYRYYDGYNNDPAYTSHSHGWSSGPTSALTFYLLGLTVTSTQGQTWNFAPHLNTGVPAAEGGFETPLGRFDASWSFDEDSNGNDVLNVQISTPPGTAGTVNLPSDMLASYTRNGLTKNLTLRGSPEITLQGGTHELSWDTDPGMCSSLG
ncbi:glycoside hydrolase family 78 protein [Macrolepiota fuliginosa MF-IS2]|uniref:Glycoside hydrolase family 78 protein n=1 Tax=Macrolepiota fuliginosa MF-IS2 TaxID=1400762 RepID=A0A9P6C482_9AGAR|nr:glycoside hydrolase family 78 protein [Macrolepiota fuliginosa MF-IS2]